MVLVVRLAARHGSRKEGGYGDWKTRTLSEDDKALSKMLFDTTNYNHLLSWALVHVLYSFDQYEQRPSASPPSPIVANVHSPSPVPASCDKVVLLHITSSSGKENPGGIILPPSILALRPHSLLSKKHFALAGNSRAAADSKRPFSEEY